MFNKKKWFCCCTPLLIGGMIYIGFRTEKLLMFKWFEYIRIMKYIRFFREITKQIKLPEFFIFSFPNGLWTISFLIFINITTTNTIRKILVILVVFITIGFEFAQFLKLIPGTFCLIDNLTNIFSIVLALKINKKMRCKNENI